MTQESNDKTSSILQEIWQNGQLALRLFADGRVPLLLKTLIPVAALAYIIMPIDLLPDFIPVLGQLDEVAIILLLMRLFVSLAPQDVVAEYREHRAGGAAGASAHTSTDTHDSAAKASRDDVIDADFRVVNDA